MNALRTLCVCVAVALFLSAAAEAAPVTVEYEAKAKTIVGAPFGLTIPMGTPVTGYFTYDTATADTNPLAATGDYPHAAGGAFEAKVLGTTITGSATPWVQVKTPSTFRIWDGPRNVGPEGGIMSINGVPATGIDLWISIVGAHNELPTDALPDPFPDFPFGFLGTPHTFSLTDGNGGELLLQIDRIVVPEPASAGLLAVGAAAGLLRRSRRRK